MNKTIFFKKLSTVIVVLFFLSIFVACDKDFNTIGSDVVGDENFNFESISLPVTAFNQKVDAVQTSNLPINQLGIYNSSVFGRTTANFVTQLNLATVKPTFTSHVEIDSVVLTVPYFSRFKSSDASGVNTFELDSVYTSNSNPETYDPIDLKVYENGYYLRDFDPNDNLNPQKYYSNQDADFEVVKLGSPLNNSTLTSENIAFVPSKKEYVKYKVDPATLAVPAAGKEVESRSTPRMRLHLDKTHFKNKIITPASVIGNPDFDNNNAFESYFRGLYFQVQTASSGNMMTLDFTKGDVTIYYKQDKTVSVTPQDIANREMKNLVLNMTGNTVNLYTNNDNPTYLNAVANPNAVNGDQKLYVKGGQGATAFIDLPSVLNTYKNNKWLINEANLTFTIDNVTMGSALEPQRIYIYNVDNNVPIIDYLFDSSSNSQFPKLNRFVHGGIIEKENTLNGRGIKYKIRITEHINNIINKDSANARIGVVVTENINFENVNAITNKKGFLKNKIIFTNPQPQPSEPNIKFDRLPMSSLISPLGTVLHGTYPVGHPDNAKGIKLNIYYTKSN